MNTQSCDTSVYDVFFQEENTALHLAAKNGHCSVLQKIIEVGVDLDEKNFVSTFKWNKKHISFAFSLPRNTLLPQSSGWIVGIDWKGLADSWFYLKHTCVKGGHACRISMKGNIFLAPISNSKALPFPAVSTDLPYHSILSPFFSLTLAHSSTLNGYWVCFKLNFTMLYSIDLVTEHMGLLFEISLWQTCFGKWCGWNTVNDLDSKYWLSSAVIYGRAHSQLSLSAIFFFFLVLFGWCLWKVYLIVIKIWKKEGTAFCGNSGSICLPQTSCPLCEEQ